MIRNIEQKIAYVPDITHGGTRKETPPTPEIWIPNFGLLAIAGRSGTGKTSAANLLADLYGIPHDPEHVQKVGTLFRLQFATPVIGYQPRGIEIDKQMDDAIANRMKTCSIDDPGILEGRLTGVIRSEILEELDPQARIITLLFTAPTDTRIRRIAKRQREIDPSLTFKKVKHQTQERELKDLEQWTVLHPHLKGKDPFHSGLSDEKGRKIYDLVVHTGDKTVDEVVEYIHNWLKANGYVKPLPVEDRHRLPKLESNQNSRSPEQHLKHGFYTL